MRATSFYVDTVEKAATFLRKVSKMKADLCYRFVELRSVKPRGDKKAKQTRFKAELDKDNRGFYLHLPEGLRTISAVISGALVEHFCDVRKEEVEDDPWEVEYAMSRYFENPHIKLCTPYSQIVPEEAILHLDLIREYVDDILCKIHELKSDDDDDVAEEEAENKKNLELDRQLVAASMKSQRGSLRPRAVHDDIDESEDEETDMPTCSSTCGDVIRQIKRAKKRAKPNATAVPQAPLVEQQLGTLIGLLTRKLERELQDEGN